MSESSLYAFEEFIKIDIKRDSNWSHLPF